MFYISCLFSHIKLSLIHLYLIILELRIATISFFKVNFLEINEKISFNLSYLLYVNNFTL